MLGPLDDTEPLNRFIFSSRYFSTVRVKHGAFMPANDGDTSVFRTQNMNPTEVWSLGDFAAQERTLKARAEVTPLHVDQVGLKVVLDTDLHPLHANITDWPTEYHEQKMLAIELAMLATLERRVKTT